MTADRPPTPQEIPTPSPHGDEEMICYCFHVPKHKIVNFIRRERPEKVSMISHCLGAGTGCGTCVYDIKFIWKEVMAECAAEDARKGIAPRPRPTPKPDLPVIPPRGAAADLPRHSPSMDLGPIVPPRQIDTRLTPSAPRPVTPSTPAPAQVPTNRTPTFPVSAESASLELETEFDPLADAPPPAPAAKPDQDAAPAAGEDTP